MKNKHGVDFTDHELLKIKQDLLDAQENYNKVTKKQLVEDLKILVSELDLRGLKDKHSEESRFFIVNKKVIQNKSVDYLVKMSRKADLYDLRQMFKRLKGE